jgi:selenocysteine lyase/cysteine desulfurase
VILARGEFPAHRATWLPMAERGRLRVKVVEPAGRFLTADDLAGAIGPKTRLISTSLVRFDDAVRLDAAWLASACRAAGALLLLDVSQCCGAVPMKARELGADFLVCAGYKWLLGPFGTGFFWARKEIAEQAPPEALYWMGVEGAMDFSALGANPMRPARGARRWDAPETASFFNLAALEKSLELLLRAGVETIWRHNNALIEQMMDALPRDRCVPASPAEPSARGPFACFAARSPEKTAALYEKLRAERVYTGLREGSIRVAPHLYNSPRDVDRLISIVAV